MSETESDLDGALRILRGMAEDDAGPLDMDEIPLWIAAPLLAELEGRDQAAADMAHRDDLARDVAREWAAHRQPAEALWDVADELAVLLTSETAYTLTAEDVRRLIAQAQTNVPASGFSPGFASALDRLAAVYGATPEEKP